MITNNQDQLTKQLKLELLRYFENEGFTIHGVKDLQGFSQPLYLHNEGYGDQEDKMPDILAFDPKNQFYITGVIRSTMNEIDSESSLTEYNVFLDQKDEKNDTPFRLYIMVPQKLLTELQEFIRHYIHREYWYKIILVSP